MIADQVSARAPTVFPMQVIGGGIVCRQAELDRFQTNLRLDLCDWARGLKSITVVFPGVAKTVFIRGVRSLQFGEVVGFVRPAPRVVSILLPELASARRPSIQLVVEVSSPEITGAFISTKPWPCAGHCDLESPRLGYKEFAEQLGKDAGNKASQFFLELDAATNPFLFERGRKGRDRWETRATSQISIFDQAVRSALVEKMAGILIRRVQLRGWVAALVAAGGLAAAGGSPIPAASDLKRIRFTLEHAGIDQGLSVQEVRFLSTLQKELITRHFPGMTTGEPVEFEAVKEAFRQFACGGIRRRRSELPVQSAAPTDSRLSKWNGEPDSAKLFLFAEFALLAIEMLEAERDTEVREFWTRMLPILEEIQPIYAKSYAPGKPRKPGKPGFADYRERERVAPTSQARRAGERQRAKGAGRARSLNKISPEHVAEKIGQNILAAFPGDFEVTPTPATTSSYAARKLNSVSSS